MLGVPQTGHMAIRHGSRAELGRGYFAAIRPEPPASSTLGEVHREPTDLESYSLGEVSFIMND